MSYQNQQHPTNPTQTQTLNPTLPSLTTSEIITNSIPQIGQSFGQNPTPSYSSAKIQQNTYSPAPAGQVRQPTSASNRVPSYTPTINPATSRATYSTPIKRFSTPQPQIPTTTAFNSVSGRTLPTTSYNNAPVRYHSTNAANTGIRTPINGQITNLGTRVGQSPTPIRTNGLSSNLGLRTGTTLLNGTQRYPQGTIGGTHLGQTPLLGARTYQTPTATQLGQVPQQYTPRVINRGSIGQYPSISQPNRHYSNPAGIRRGSVSPIRTGGLANENRLLSSPIVGTNIGAVRSIAPQRDLIDDFNTAPDDMRADIQDFIGMNTMNCVDSNNAVLKIGRELNNPANRHVYQNRKNGIERWQEKLNNTLKENR